MLQQPKKFQALYSHRGFRRGSAFIAAGVVAGLALLSAGVPEFRWPWSKEEPLVLTTPDVSPGIAAPVGPGTSAPALPEIPTGTDSSLSTAPLPLILSGTMVGRNSREGTAFIGIDRNSPQTYAAGALLANGAQLIGVYRDHVVLKKGSETAELYLQERQPKSADTERQLSALLQVGGAPTEEMAIAASSDVITDYLRPSPVFDGELIKGYQVYPGKRSGVFAQMGLKGGDVIIALNDAPFAAPEQAIDLLRQLSSGTALVATIRRDGKTQRLSLDGGLIVADLELQKNAAAVNAALPPGPPPI